MCFSVVAATTDLLKCIIVQNKIVIRCDLFSHSYIDLLTIVVEHISDANLAFDFQS